MPIRNPAPPSATILLSGGFHADRSGPYTTHPDPAGNTTSSAYILASEVSDVATTSPFTGLAIEVAGTWTADPGGDTLMGQRTSAIIPSGSTALLTAVIRGEEIWAEHKGTGRLFALQGSYIHANNSSSATVDLMWVNVIQFINSGAGTVTGGFGLSILSPTNAGTIVNMIGLAIEPQLIGTFTGTAYGIKQTGTLDRNFFAGWTQFGLENNYGPPQAPVDARWNPTALSSNGQAAIRAIVGPVSQNATTPVAGDYVALYGEITSSATRDRIWGINTLCVVSPGGDGTNAEVSACEIDISNDFADAPDWGTAGHKLGITSASGGSKMCTAAFSTFAFANVGAWRHGLFFMGVGNSVAGSSLIKCGTLVNVDYGIDLSGATTILTAAFKSDGFKVDPTGNVDITGYLLTDATNTASFKRTGGAGILLDGTVAGQDIEWLTSTFTNGYGFRQYALYPGSGQTEFRMAVRSNSATWTDILRLSDLGEFYQFPSIHPLTFTSPPPDGTRPAVFAVSIDGKGTVNVGTGRVGIYSAISDPASAVNRTITGMSRVGTTVTVTSNSHGFSLGEKIAIYGVTHTFNAEVNAPFTVANPTTNTFDITVAGLSSGTYTSGGTATNRFMAYAFMANVIPSLARTGLTGAAVFADDMGGFVALNGGTGKGTDAFYIGHNPVFGDQITGTSEWAVGFSIDCNADYGIKFAGHFASGIDISGATIDTAAFKSTGFTVSPTGSASVAGFRLGTTATAGHVLTADTSGNGTWQAAAGGGGTAASQAEQEAAASTTVFVSPGSQHFHPSAAKFWVKATGNATTIVASYNMTSWADTGIGIAGGTIATDFSSADWCGQVAILGSATNWNTTNTSGCGFSAQAAGTFTVTASQMTEGGTAAANPIDPVSWFVEGFGDH